MKSNGHYIQAELPKSYVKVQAYVYKYSEMMNPMHSELAQLITAYIFMHCNYSNPFHMYIFCSW